MSILPPNIVQNFEIKDTNNAMVILKNAYPGEWNDLITLLSNFSLKRSEIIQSGGRKSPIADNLDSYLYTRGWVEKRFDTVIEIDGIRRAVPTHKVDCFKNKVAIEVEWNNKDPFFDRDLNNFRLLYELGAVQVGIIITRATELQSIFNQLGKGSSYGASTTHMDKLIPKIDGKGAGGCPVVAFGIKASLYDPNS